MTDEKQKPYVLYDIGGVMQIHNRDYEHDHPEKNQDGKWNPGVLEAVKIMHKREYKQGILSYCGKAREAAVRNQLIRDGFGEYIPSENWYFVRDRKHKAKVMLQVNADILVDDTFQIVQQCRAIGKKVLHFNSRPVMGEVDTVQDWYRLLDHPSMNQ